MKLSGVLGLCLRVLGSTGLDTRMQHGEEMPAECQPLLAHILVFWFAVGGKDLSFFRAMQADHEVARMPLRTLSSRRRPAVRSFTCCGP